MKLIMRDAPCDNRRPIVPGTLTEGARGGLAHAQLHGPSMWSLVVGGRGTPTMRSRSALMTPDLPSLFVTMMAPATDCQSAPLTNSRMPALPVRSLASG